ncbi:DNA mismatch repair protein MutT [Acinetobacter sp. ANC 5054]|uniref:NUDIX hydrolase n=1 Tax=Acinetobacter sp. ANC 5054 TaxID=1977877 RepID=UPI000A32DD2A|nr:NUDIX domain-containing protein [Acinetobacter sp. ANC 5054]OTG81499.1 DNA mismatch repair protein MutT [Acinetobacter sp. ANC 5054]
MNTITVAAAIILNPQHELLVVRKKHTEFFMQVGGKLESNEAPDVTILREIQEEIGCAAEIEQFVGRFETLAANEPDHLLVSYVYVINLHDQPKIDAEIAAMQWVSLDDQHTQLAPLTREVVIPWVKQNLIAHMA